MWLPLMRPQPGPGRQPRHVHWLGIELTTFWFAGQHSIHWATPARAIYKDILKSYYTRLVTKYCSLFLISLPFSSLKDNCLQLFYRFGYLHSSIQRVYTTVPWSSRFIIYILILPLEDEDLTLSSALPHSFLKISLFF